MVYDLGRSDARVKWLVTCLLATFGLSYLFGGWMVGLFAGFTPGAVARTYAGAPMRMAMPPESTVVVEHPMTMQEFGTEDRHTVDQNLLVQDTHVHVPMYGVIAGVLAVIVLGLKLSPGMGYFLIALLFAAPWLDFAGMWLTKLLSPAFAVLTVIAGWAMGAAYLVVAALALTQMWLSPGGTRQ